MTAAELVDAEDAARLILTGDAPPGLEVDGHLVLADAPDLDRLPDGLAARRLTLRNLPNLTSLPDGLRVRRLVIENCPALTTLPAGLSCHELTAAGSALVELPDDLEVEYRLDLSDSPDLVRLPAGLVVGSLVLRGCTGLHELPDGLEATFLDLAGCSQLTAWPRALILGCGHLNLAGCTGFAELPAGVTELARLDLRDCARITELPAGLDIRSWVDVAGSGLTEVPARLDGRLRWRGVRVTGRIAFRPETLTVDEILAETNAEVRRVMLERVGFEWFFDRAGAEVLDADRDAGGARKLLRLPIPGDEDLVCVSLACPSTGRRYVLRVPPATRTASQAAAWLAGFDDPKDYAPLLET
ncbi:MAG: hypothetical protein K2X87_17705 [Gemmataceae bacterium]|nr:hypothetical protein [Gemmataceae bacterium]